MKHIHILTALLLFSCNSRYSNKELEALKQGDTIYIEYAGEMTRAIVIKNAKKDEMLEVKRANIYYRELYSLEFLKYSEL